MTESSPWTTLSATARTLAFTVHDWNHWTSLSRDVMGSEFIYMDSQTVCRHRLWAEGRSSWTREGATMGQGRG